MSIEFYRVTNGRNTLLVTPFEDKTICVPFGGSSRVVDFGPDTNWSSYMTLPVTEYTDKGHNLIDVTPRTPLASKVDKKNAVFAHEDGTYWVLCGQTGRFYGFARGDVDSVESYAALDFVKEIGYCYSTPDYPLRRIG